MQSAPTRNAVLPCKYMISNKALYQRIHARSARASTDLQALVQLYQRLG